MTEISSGICWNHSRGCARLRRWLKIRFSRKFSENYDFWHVTWVQNFLGHDFRKEHVQIHRATPIKYRKINTENPSILYMSIPSHRLWLGTIQWNFQYLECAWLLCWNLAARGNFVSEIDCAYQNLKKMATRWPKWWFHTFKIKLPSG